MASESKEQPKQQRVVVIGGGFAGTTAIAGLRKANPTVEIVLVEPKEYFENAIAAFRSPFDDKVRELCLFPLAPFCDKHRVEHVKAKVQSLWKRKATLDNGEDLEFDVCVVAAGATTQWAQLGRGVPATSTSATVDGRSTELQKEGSDILSAGSLLIVGGGIIGTELAGDAAAYAKRAGQTLKVTLVHSGAHLCHTEFTEKAAELAKKDLEELGVRVVLGGRAKAVGNAGWKLESTGETLEAGKVIVTTGLSPINDMMRTPGEDGLQQCLDERGWIVTDDYFRASGSGSTVFAFGDCCATLPNTASQAMNQGSVIGHNVKLVLKGLAEGTGVPADAEFKSYQEKTGIYMATVGPNGGVASLFTYRWFLPWLKNTSLSNIGAKQILGVC